MAKDKPAEVGGGPAQRPITPADGGDLSKVNAEKRLAAIKAETPLRTWPGAK